MQSVSLLVGIKNKTKSMDQIVSVLCVGTRSEVNKSMLKNLTNKEFDSIAYFERPKLIRKTFKKVQASVEPIIETGLEPSVETAVEHVIDQATRMAGQVKKSR